MKNDPLSTYDSLTSYYNRIGDRFHDCEKWDQLKTNENPPKKKRHLTLENVDHPNENNHFKLKSIPATTCSSYLQNSLLVKEMSTNPEESSSQSSLTTITHQHLPNGLIVTNHKH